MVRILLLCNLLYFSCSGQNIKDSFYLTSITTTDRISSNHFSEIVHSADGYAYISTFRKGPLGKDEIYICKLDQEGRIQWTIGAGTEGRATALSLDKNNGIWVVGYYKGTFTIGDTQYQTDEEKLFILHLDPAGKVLGWLENKYGFAKPFNVAVSCKGDLLVSGIMGQKLGFDTKLIQNSKDNQPFLAYFGPSLSCVELLNIEAEIHRIREFEDIGFVITGRFNNQLTFGDTILYTTGAYDDDAFIGLYSNGFRWCKQLGHVGIRKPGHRSSETGWQIQIKDNNEIVLLASLDRISFSPFGFVDTETLTLTLLTFDAVGRQKSRKEVIRGISRRSPASFALDHEGNYWICANFQKRAEVLGSIFTSKLDTQTCILKISKELVFQKIILPGHGPNTLFRSAHSSGESVVFAGHFQDYLSIENQRIVNDGRHGLFYLEID